MALPLAPVISTTELPSATADRKHAAVGIRPRVLVVTSRASSAEELKVLLRPFKFVIETCSDIARLPEIISRKKINGVLMEWSQDAPRVIAQFRGSPSNRSAVICAVVDRVTQPASAFTAGCNFVIDKASSPSHVQRLMRVLAGLVIREHRRYYRCGQRIPVTLLSSENVGSQMESLNLSESGIALRLAQPCHINDRLRLAIDVSDGHQPIQLEAQVRWVGPGNHTGLRFSDVPVSSLLRLQKWIDAHITIAEKNLLKHGPVSTL